MPLVHNSYWSVDHDGNFETHATMEEATQACKAYIEYCLDRSVDGWPDSTDQIACGTITHTCRRIMDRPVEPSDGHDFDRTWDYGLVEEKGEG